jgi:hypothetical protein
MINKYIYPKLLDGRNIVSFGSSLDSNLQLKYILKYALFNYDVEHKKYHSIFLEFN